jgi:hypothetical protein
VDGNPSAIEDVLGYITSKAPDDVLRTIAWLTDEGWTPQSVRGGRHESFGNVLVEFGKAGMGLRIALDRSQWMMNLRLPGWSRWFGLGIVLDTMSDREEWTSVDGLPRQLPLGVSWATALPLVLSWLTEHPNVEEQLDAMRRRRYGVLFPGQDPDR